MTSKKVKFLIMHQEEIKTSINEAAKLLCNDNLIIHSTDTVFGISGSYRSIKAYNLIYKVKKRTFKKPLGVLLSSIKQIEIFSTISLSTISECIPLLELGITLLLPIKKNLPSHLTSQSDFIGIRIPNHETTKRLINKTGPLISTSANISGSPPIKYVSKNTPLLKRNVYHLHGDYSKNHMCSTILKYNKENYMLIREGNISKKDISKHITLSLNNHLL